MWHLTDSSTWHDFFSQTTESTKTLELLEPLRAQTMQRWWGVTQNRNDLYRYKSRAAVQEEELVKNCLGRVMVFGDKILEDTSVAVADLSAVRGYDVGRKAKRGFHKLWEAKYSPDKIGENLTFVEPSSARVDIMVRFRCGAAELGFSHAACFDVVPYLFDRRQDGVAYHAESFRVMPWNCIGGIEMKKPTATLLDHVKQAAEYCESLLTVTPRRKYAFAALTNLEAVVFVAATVKYDARQRKRVFYYFHSDLIEGDEKLVSEMTSFLITTPASLDATTFTFPYNLFTPTRALGRGASSCVMQGTLHENENSVTKQVVLKISANPHCIAVERYVLSQLFAAYPAVKTFPCLLESPSIAALLDTTYCEVFDECYREIASFTKDMVLEVWNVLQLAHSIGILHCDVRTTNCMLRRQQPPSSASASTSGQLVVIDWGFARGIPGSSFPREMTVMKPTSVTASPYVLKHYDDPVLEILIADEAYSLILLALQAKFPLFNVLHEPLASADVTLMQREDYIFDRALTKAAQKYDQNHPPAPTATSQFALLEELKAIMNVFDEARATLQAPEIHSKLYQAVDVVFKFEFNVKG